MKYEWVFAPIYSQKPILITISKFQNSKITPSEKYLKEEICSGGKAMSRRCAVAKSVKEEGKVEERKLRVLEEWRK